MAGTITIVNSFALTNGNRVIPTSGSSPQTITQNGQGGGTPSVITAVTTGTGTTLDVTTITTMGWARIQNLDLTNYVQLGVISGGTFYPFARLKPNEPASQFRVEPGVVLAVKANTASCKVDCQVFED